MCHGQDAAKRQRSTLEEDREIMQGTVEGLKNDITEADKVLTALQGETTEIEEKSKDVEASTREQVGRSSGEVDQRREKIT